MEKPSTKPSAEFSTIKANVTKKLHRDLKCACTNNDTNITDVITKFARKYVNGEIKI